MCLIFINSSWRMSLNVNHIPFYLQWLSISICSYLSSIKKLKWCSICFFVVFFFFTTFFSFFFTFSLILYISKSLLFLFLFISLTNICLFFSSTPNTLVKSDGGLSLVCFHVLPFSPQNYQQRTCNEETLGKGREKERERWGWQPFYISLFYLKYSWSRPCSSSSSSSSFPSLPTDTLHQCTCFSPPSCKLFSHPIHSIPHAYFSSSSSSQECQILIAFLNQDKSKGKKRGKEKVPMVRREEVKNCGTRGGSKIL